MQIPAIYTILGARAEESRSMMEKAVEELEKRCEDHGRTTCGGWLGLVFLFTVAVGRLELEPPIAVPLLVRKFCLATKGIVFSRERTRRAPTIVKKLNILIVAMTDVEESKVHIQYPYVPCSWTREQDPCWPQVVAFDHTIESEVPNWLTGNQDLLEFISQLTVAAQ